MEDKSKIQVGSDDDQMPEATQPKKKKGKKKKKNKKTPESELPKDDRQDKKPGLYGCLDV